ncbi:hypothetical protein [Roseospira visakhapatnamensis]|uniref:Uncharacterized protein n=1 Tax=Roseospira visakhapatnamensis TaxID=390880 RepID=A0A7W6RCR0_9PROT|nr:hypothetical protein [Roseospira visakhapatnamensis]MBB4265589.1 hypothetical protein [Roseospira visakhapatnamensis]
MVKPRRIGLALLLAALVLPSPWSGPAPAAEPAAFVAGTEDLPLMPGLRQLSDTGVVFETGRGRLIEAYAVGPVTPDQVRAFYTATLPQLGWRPEGAGLGFRREGETLQIEVLAGGPPRTVRFRIAPAQ